MVRTAVQHSIPIELLRTLTLIADQGSVTRAARLLGLSQPAVSAQIKRLEHLLGGELFVKRGRIVQLSNRGQMILSYARRIVALNDQLRSVSGADPSGERLRVGLPMGLDAELITPIYKSLSAIGGQRVFLTCDTQQSLLHALDSGFLDAAFLVDVTPISATSTAQWTERWYWVKAPDLVLRPDLPVPLVSWPGSVSDRLCTTAFRQGNVEHLAAFVASDRGLRKAAVNAGMGLMAASERSIKVSNLSIARAHVLPEFPSPRGGIYIRDGMDRARSERITKALQAVVNAPG